MDSYLTGCVGSPGSIPVDGKSNKYYSDVFFSLQAKGGRLLNRSQTR